MWILADIKRQKTGSRTWLCPEVTYSIGRKDCDIERPEDKFLSRKHATITVEKNTREIVRSINARIQVTVRDLNSSGGTHVNKVKVDAEHDTVLKKDDEIKLGCTTFKLIYEPIVICCSGLQKGPKNIVFERITKFGMKQVDEWLPNVCTHLYTKRIKLVPKVCLALIECRNIIGEEWFNQIEAGMEKRLSLPDPGNYLPPVNEKEISALDISFFPDERRRTLFDGKTFLVFSREQLQNITLLITQARGKAVLCILGEHIENRSEAIVSFVKSHANPLMVRPSEIDKVPGDDSGEKWAELAATTENLQTRLINEQEIFYAVFYTSTSTFCNPSVPAPSIPIQVPLLPSRKLHNGAQIAVARLAGETPQLPRDVTKSFGPMACDSATATPPSPKPATSSNPKPVLLAGRSGGPSKIAALGFKTRNRVFDIFDLDNEPTDNLITQPPETGKAIEQRIVPPDPQPQPRRRIFSYDISQPEVKSQAFLKPNQKFVEWADGSESEMDDPENVGRPPIASLATRALIKEAAVTVMSEKRVAEPENGEGESTSHGVAAKKRPIPCNAAPPELVLSPTTTVHQGRVAKLSKQPEQDAEESEIVQNFEHAKTKKWTVEKARTADGLDEEDLGSVKNEKDAQKNMIKVEIGNLVVRNEPPGQQPRKWTEGNGGRPHDNGRVNFKRFQKARYAGMGGQRITIIKMVPHESGTLGTGANESWLKSSGESSSNTNSAKQKSCKQSEESRDEDLMLEREPPAKQKPRKKSEESDDGDFLSKRKPPVKRRSRKQSEDEDFVPKKKEPPAKRVCTRAKQKHDDSLMNREPPKTPKQWTVQEMIGDDDDEGFGSPFTPK